MTQAKSAERMFDDSCVKRAFILVHEPGRVPEKKGAFFDYDRVRIFLRELIACRPVGTKYTVIELTWDDDIWVNDGGEWISMEELPAPRKARTEDPLAGLRLQVRHRLHAAIRHLKATGSLNRADIQRLGEVSVPQASADLNLIKARFPGLMTYDASAKCYRIAPPTSNGGGHG